MDPLVGLVWALAALVVVPWVLSRWISRVVVHDWEEGLLLVDGRLRRRLAPGAYWLLSPWDECKLVDKRERAVTVPGQEVLTSDSITVKLSLAVTWSVRDAQVAEMEVANLWEAAYSAAQVGVRAVVAEHTVDQLLERRGEVSAALAERVRPGLERLGLKLQAAEVRDITLGGDLKKAYADVVKARKLGQSALERARGETAALRSLANAARMVEGNPALLHLRTLQAIETGTAAGSTFVLGTALAPLPAPGGNGKGRPPAPAPAPAATGEGNDSEG